MSTEHKPYVTTTYGMKGYFSVLLTWDEDINGYTPWNSGCFGYETKEEAEVDAKSWAEAEGIEFKP